MDRNRTAKEFAMKKYACLITCVLIALLIPPLAAFADMGPKPSVNVSFENMPDGTCWCTLLSADPSRGPWQVWDGKDEDARNLSDAPEDVWKKIAGYSDPGGYYFIQGPVKVVGNDESYSWGYYPPDDFKILLYYPETDSFRVSGAVKSYAFDSYFTVDMSGADGLLIPSGSVRRSYPLGGEIASFLIRVAITIAVEIAVALLFRIKDRKSLLVIAGVNVATQVALNVVLSAVGFRAGSLYAILIYVPLEIAVFVLETVVYAAVMKRIAEKPKGFWMAYAFLANLASFSVGWPLAMILPEIF
ncbi:MAG: hypothetical protein IKS28_03960 [Clostridia bacterium]|nr:hypothetical protein [Clostridia bacterium]